MSYKAFAAIKEHMEIEAIKKMSPEEINRHFNTFHERNQQLTQNNGKMLEMLKVVDALYQEHAKRTPDEIPLHQVNDAKYTYGDARKIRALITEIESE